MFASLLDTLVNTVHRDAITAPLLENAASHFRSTLRTYPYHVESSLLPLLNQLGIGATTFGHISHPHPAHKSIEIHLLFEHWSPRIRSPATVLYMKPEKFHKLQSENPNFQTLANFRHTSKDLTRYPLSLPKELTTSILVIHDALMYITPAQIIALFEQNPVLQHVYASLVVPPESYHSLPSLFPLLYRHHFVSDKLVYQLEGNTTGSYTQPRSAQQWLSLSSIKSSALSLSVTVLESWLSVHSLLISRSDEVDSSPRFFMSPAAYSLPEPDDTSIPLHHRLVPIEVYNSLFNYVRAVRTLRVTDPAGFVRTQRSKSEYNWVQPSAWDYLITFTLQTHAQRPPFYFDATATWYERLWRRICSYTWWLYKRSHVALLSAYALYTVQPCRLALSITSKCATDNTWLRSMNAIVTSHTGYAISSFALIPAREYYAKHLHSSLYFSWFQTPSFVLTSIVGLASAYLYYRSHLTTTAQELSDSYLNYFHPEPWTLQIPTTSLDVIPDYSAFPQFTEPHALSPAPKAVSDEPQVDVVIGVVPDSSEPLEQRSQCFPLPTIDPIVTAIDELHNTPDYEIAGHVDAPSPSQIIPSSDPTSDGILLPYKEIHNIPCEPHELCFLSSRRIKPSTLPYPRLDCLLKALSQTFNVPASHLWDQLCELFPDSQLDGPEERRGGFTTEHLEALAWKNSWTVQVSSGAHTFSLGPPGAKPGSLLHQAGEVGHWSSANIRGARPTLYARAAQSFKMPDSSLLPFLRVHSYAISLHRAKNLASNLKNECDGVLGAVFRQNPSLDASYYMKLDGRVDVAESRQVQLIHISGFPGCGKSFPIAQLLKTSNFQSNSRVVVPTVELRAEWKSLWPLRSSDAWRISTWETSLFKSAPVLVIDEVYKLPNGFLDLILIADPAIEFVILLGDPCQTVYSSTNPDSSNYRLQPEVDHLAPYRDLYCFWTHRLPQNIAKFFQVQTSNDAEGFVHVHHSPNPKLPLLCPSVVTARALSSTCSRTQTFASSQGSTFDPPVQLFITRDIRMCSKSTIFVALTRSRKGIILTGQHSLLRSDPTCEPLLASLLEGRTFPFHTLFSQELRGLSLISTPLKTRKDLLRGGDQDAPILHDVGPLPFPFVNPNFVPETRLPLHYSIASAFPPATSFESTYITPCPFEPVYPGLSYETFVATLYPSRDPESLEQLFRGDHTNQFPYLDLPFSNGTQTLSVLAPKHDEKHDPTLLFASIPKRLRFRFSDTPYQVTAIDEAVGHALFHSLCSVYHRSPSHREPFDWQLFLECINLNEYCQLSSKSQAVIAANARRSDPDWRWSAVRIFSKTQHKINSSSLFSGWKACQTLALMHDAIVLLFGPIKKYQRIFDKRDRPANLFIYGGQSPMALSEFAQSHMTSSPSVANDYTAFDQSQHGEAVVLERLKMQRLNIPDDLIQLHCTLKTSIVTQFGPLTCMRLTGEPGTYDDNTDYNLAVLASLHDLTSQAIFVSGDDSLINPIPPPNPLWHKLQPFLSVKFKIEYTLYPLFCGYFVGKAGAVRAPLPLLVKCVLAEDDSSLPEKLTSYLTEFSIGHSLGDQLWTLLPLSEVQPQAALYDFFCRRCSREQKVLLNIGELPLDVITDMLSCGFQLVARPLFCLLSRQSRLRYLQRSANPCPYDDPQLPNLTTEL